MAVRANSTRLVSRLRNLQQELPSAVNVGMLLAAEETIDVVDNATRAEWSGDDGYQVGFDIDSFSASIKGIEVTSDGGYGILNVDKMGTAEDFEQIGQGSGLWHGGGKRGDAFRRFIIERPGQAEALGQLRKAIWGNKNPQWWFFEEGNLQYGGVFDTRLGMHTIATAAFDVADNVRDIIEVAVTRRLRERGVL